MVQRAAKRMPEISWKLIDDDDTKFFECKSDNKLVLYSTKCNEKRFLERFRPVFLKQIHSDIIIDVDKDSARVGDGLLTQRSNLALGVRIADCLPVYLFNETKICIIHCGWQGIIKGIAKRAKRFMDNYKYVLGASIGPCCYEVKEDIARLFTQQYENAVIRRNRKYFIDLKGAVIEDLGEEKLIASLDFCTKCHPAYFYSYRRGDKNKRDCAIIKYFSTHPDF
jgi:hypothetical protein